MPSGNPPTNAQTRACNRVIAGYIVATLGLVAVLTINGVSGIPAAVAMGGAVLVATGLVLPAAGMLQLRQTINPDRSRARSGLLLLALGLIGLLVGVMPLATSSSLSALFFVSGIVIATSAASALGGAFLLRGYYGDIGASTRAGVDYLILGTALIFSGVAVILGSNIAKYFWLSDVGNNVFTDVGVAVSACGCVVSAYSFFVLQARRLRPVDALEVSRLSSPLRSS